MNKPRYSVIIPVYNRPDDLKELLESLRLQTQKNFEVIVVEDGSTVTCEDVTRQFSGNLNVQYYYKSNSGPGPTRNFGFVHAQGDFFVVFDSDCILPPTYFEAVDKALEEFAFDAWGGPDQAHVDFTFAQRAMGYTMSSWLTTGGIRGGKQRMGWFQPRSFNMGISKMVFESTGGYRFSRFAEDIEFSIRMKKGGFSIGLIAGAFVYHKRRTNFLQFFKQVYNFGKGRVLVGKVYPEEVKITHWLPTFFTVASLILPFLYLIDITLFKTAVIFFGAYLVLIFVHSLVANRNFVVACMSIPSAVLQLWGYGLGFLIERLGKTRTVNDH